MVCLFHNGSCNIIIMYLKYIVWDELICFVSELCYLIHSFFRFPEYFNPNVESENVHRIFLFLRLIFVT